MKKNLIVAFAIYSSHLFGEIQPIFSIQETVPYAKNWTENTLVVFDIDETLTRLNDPSVDLHGIWVHHSNFFETFLKAHPSDVAALALAIPLVTIPGDLLEKETPAFIQALQERNIKTLALTAVMGGKVGDMLMEDRRISELLRVGIDFSRSFRTVDDLIFTDLAKGPLGRHPIHKQGMILTNTINKGEVLVAFLKTIDWIPDQIIFFDDIIKNLQNVESALHAFNPSISFHGFHIRLVETLHHKRVEENILIETWEELIDQAKEELL